MDHSSTPNGAEFPPLAELAGKNYATLRQTARLLGKSYQTILRYIREDADSPPKLRAVRVGGEWRVYEDELRRFLSQGNNV